MVGPDSRSSLKQHWETLRDNGLATREEMIAAMVDPSGRTEDDVRHGLKESFRPRVLDRAMRTPAGVARTDAARAPDALQCHQPRRPARCPVTRARLQLTFAGADPGALIDHARSAGFLPAAPPARLRADRVAVDPARPLPALAAAHDRITATWGEAAMLQISRTHDEVFVDRAAWDVTAEATLAMARDWPFEACTTTSLDSTWWPGYHAIHGWAFLLKGNGHRLVSPRIVDRGPWRRLRDASHDVTLFQFHDLDASAGTALEQARPGHALLAPVWLGGHYASPLWVFRGSATGYKPTLYDPATQTSVILVQDREVPASEMGIASATRVHQIFSQPVAGVAFVYMDEAAARRQLPALWLYGLEVRAVTSQGEQRIDRDYQPPPPPEPPSWVKRLA